MLYRTYYNSPCGRYLIVSDGSSLIGLWLEQQKYYADKINEALIDKEDLPIFIKVKKLLDKFFAGENPNFKEIPLAPQGNLFRQTIWKLLCEIPYGKVETYGEIARRASKILNKSAMSAQAVGGAIGHNPISIIIPCHRVVAKNGKLTGYAGGVDIKRRLLEIEKAL